MPEIFEFTRETAKRRVERDPPMERKETRGDLLDTIPRKKTLSSTNRSFAHPERAGCAPRTTEPGQRNGAQAHPTRYFDYGLPVEVAHEEVVEREGSGADEYKHAIDD